MTLLEVTIKTGRTHQIRVHLASAGYVIAGDDKYGDFELNRQLVRSGLKRMFLHAWRLALETPDQSSEPMELVSQLPEELQNWVKALAPTAVIASYNRIPHRWDACKNTIQEPTFIKDIQWQITQNSWRRPNP